MNSEHPWPRVRGGIVVSTVWFCVLACVTCTVPGLAQGEPTTPRPAQSEPKPSGAGDAKASAEADVQGSAEYRELIDQALSEFKHKNWPEARVLFRRAHELNPNARTQRGMGVVSYEMRDYVQAVPALAAALVDTRQALTAAQRKECEGLLARARTFVGAYALVLEPAEVEISVDGTPPVRDADGRMLVPFGEHTLQASAGGYQSSTSKLSVQGGERGELRIVLYRPQAAATLVARVEKTVDQPAPAAAGGGTSASGAPATVKSGGLRYTWVALGASAAFGAAAAGTWYAGEGKVDDLDAKCERQAALGQPCERGGVDTGSVQRFERLTNGLLGISAGALVGAVVLAAFEWPRERKLALDLSPRQLSVRGSF